MDNSPNSLRDGVEIDLFDLVTRILGAKAVGVVVAVEFRYTK